MTMETKITMNGINNYPQIKKSLNEDAISLLKMIHSDSGHLGDVIGGIESLISSIKIKSEKLKEEFRKQKNGN